MADTQLMAAVKSGDPHLAVKWILESPNDINVKDDETGSTPLHHAVKINSVELVKQLLKAGADINIPDNIGRNTPLMLAIKNDFNDIINRLLKQSKINIEARDVLGRTPLMLAIKGRHYEAVRLLAEAGANAKEEDYYGTPVEDYMAMADDKEIFNILEYQGQENDFVRIVFTFDGGIQRTAYVNKDKFTGCDFSKIVNTRVMAPPDLFGQLTLDN